MSKDTLKPWEVAKALSGTGHSRLFNTLTGETYTLTTEDANRLAKCLNDMTKQIQDLKDEVQDLLLGTP